MSVLEKIRSWLGMETHIKSPQNTLREILALARRAKYTEDYTRALLVLDQATQLAKSLKDIPTQAIITLHRADVLMQLQRWQEAAILLEDAYREAERTRQRTQLAYILCSQGQLAQMRGQWRAAQGKYEAALELATESYSIGAEGRARGHLADIYLNEGNASYAEHLLRAALPKLETSGDVELSSYFVGRLGEAMLINGNVTDGKAVIERALVLAVKMHYHTYIRRWNRKLGDLAMQEARYVDADRHYTAILETLPAPPPANQTTIETMCLANKTALHLHKFESAMQLAKQAVELSQQTEDAKLIAEAAAALGLTLYTSGNKADAQPYLMQAAAYYDQYPEAAEYIDILRHIASIQAEAGERDQAHHTFERALSIGKKSGNPLDLAHTYSSLGLLYRQRGDIQNALAQWSDALTIYEKQGQSLHLARLYCDIAEAEMYLGEPRAIKSIEKALMLLTSVDDVATRGIILSNAANLYAHQGEIESAESFYQESIEIARKHGELSIESIRLGNYGYFQLITGRIKEGLATSKTARQLSKEAKLDLQAAVQTHHIGLGQYLSTQYDAALETYQDAMNQLPNGDYPHWQATFQIAQATALYQLQQIDRAVPLLQQALKAGHDLKDIPVTVRALSLLAQIDLDNNAIEQANQRLDEAATIAQRTQQRRLQAEVLHVQSRYYDVKGDLLAAQSTWNKARKLFDMVHAPYSKPAWLQETGSSQNN